MSRSRVRSLGGYAIDRRPLAIAAYRRLWMASAVCAVGGSFSVVAIPTQLFTVTGSSATVGASAAFVALAAAALWTGALADTPRPAACSPAGPCPEVAVAQRSGPVRKSTASPIVARRG